MISAQDIDYVETAGNSFRLTFEGGDRVLPSARRRIQIPRNYPCKGLGQVLAALMSLPRHKVRPELWPVVFYFEGWMLYLHLDESSGEILAIVKHPAYGTSVRRLYHFPHVTHDNHERLRVLSNGTREFLTTFVLPSRGSVLFRFTRSVTLEELHQSLRASEARPSICPVPLMRIPESVETLSRCPFAVDHGGEHEFLASTSVRALQSVHTWARDPNNNLSRLLL